MKSLSGVSGDECPPLKYRRNVEDRFQFVVARCTSAKMPFFSCPLSGAV
jgi:hypothetical protein